MTRGLALNNPGNIRHGAQWFGLSPVQSDPDFCEFIVPVYGIRAMARILEAYDSRGLHTVRQIVSTWAPAADGNDVDAYALAVAGRLQIDPDETFAVIPFLPHLIPAMIQQEQGQQPYPPELIAQGIHQSFVGVPT